MKKKGANMFNPNNTHQMAQSIADDLNYLGFIVVDWENHYKQNGKWNEWSHFVVGNQSIEFCKVIVTERGVSLRTRQKTYAPIKYKGSLEQLSKDVCSKVVKVALAAKKG